MAGISNAIRNALETVWSTQGRSFASFEVVRDGRADPDLWIQYLDGELNLRWPRTDSPAEALPRLGLDLPPTVLVLSWHPDSTAILGVGDLRVDEVAGLVEALAERVLGGGPGGNLEASVRRHG